MSVKKFDHFDIMYAWGLSGLLALEFGWQPIVGGILFFLAMLGINHWLEHRRFSKLPPDEQRKQHALDSMRKSIKVFIEYDDTREIVKEELANYVQKELPRRRRQFRR